MATLSEQINALATRIGAECKRIHTLRGGALTNLSTVDKTSIIAAINEVSGAAGTLQTALNGVAERLSTAEYNITVNATTGSTNATAIAGLRSDVGTLQTALSALQDAVAALLNDEATGTDKTWSSSKISSEINAAKQAVKNDLINGAGTEFDTLKELADLITNNKSLIEALQAAGAGMVKFAEAQSLTNPQKLQARTNIGAAGQDDFDTLAGRVTTAETSINGNTTSISTLSDNVGNTNTNFVTAFEAALADES